MEISTLTNMNESTKRSDIDVSSEKWSVLEKNIE